MSEVWYPGGTVIPGNSGGTFFGGIARCGVLHTTEGSSISGAVGAYRSANSWPHFTVGPDPSGRGYKVVQHVAIDVAARAMKNAPGGVETNRQGAIQIELVGTCDRRQSSWGHLYAPNFPREYLDVIVKLMAWIEKNASVKPVGPQSRPWRSYPESYGLGALQRMSNHEWLNFNGWCGHQHVPENDHGDPGLINIKYLLENGRVVPDKVQPRFKLKLDTIVDAMQAPRGGVWLLAETGAIYAFGEAHYFGGMNGSHHFVGRRGARLKSVPVKGLKNRRKYGSWRYAIIANTGEVYVP